MEHNTCCPDMTARRALKCLESPGPQEPVRVHYVDPGFPSQRDSMAGLRSEKQQKDSVMTLSFRDW